MATQVIVQVSLGVKGDPGDAGSPGQEGLQGPPGELTQAAADLRYGEAKLARLTSDAGAPSTAAVNTALALTLEPGLWEINGYAYVKTASTTAGAQCQMSSMNAGDNWACSCWETRGINGGSHTQRFLNSSGIGTMITILCDGGALGTNQNAYGSFTMLLNVSAQATYTMQIKQRTVTDAVNPAYLATRSWMRAVKVG